MKFSPTVVLVHQKDSDQGHRPNLKFRKILDRESDDTRKLTISFRYDCINGCFSACLTISLQDISWKIRVRSEFSQNVWSISQDLRFGRYLGFGRSSSKNVNIWSRIWSILGGYSFACGCSAMEKYFKTYFKWCYWSFNAFLTRILMRGNPRRPSCWVVRSW